MNEAGKYDVIVVGAGPAGATAAALLAEKGRRVLLLEKSRFPRYHIGESLMPFCYFTLERLGLLEEMNRIGFTKKHSVQFVRQDGKQSRPFYFFQHYDHPSSTTWQVTRSEFDQMIFNRAVELGAVAMEGTEVREVLRNESGAVIGVRVHGENGDVDYHAPITIDATGRDALVSSREKWRQRDPKLRRISMWTYYRGALRDEGLDEGSTTVAYLPEKGWFWYIPLQDDVVSVGIVAERDYLYRDTREVSEIFARELVENEWIREHLEPGEQFGKYWVTGEFSYRSEFCSADGLVLVGDAFSFLDPVFSSGVFLALKSGEMAADAIDAALEQGDVCGSQFDAYGAELCRTIEVMRKLVYAFYDPDFSFGKLIKMNPEIRPDLTDCLIGNLDKRDFRELMEALGALVELPKDLEYGRGGKPSTSVSGA